LRQLLGGVWAGLQRGWHPCAPPRHRRGARCSSALALPRRAPLRGVRQARPCGVVCHLRRDRPQHERPAFPSAEAEAATWRCPRPWPCGRSAASRTGTPWCTGRRGRRGRLCRRGATRRRRRSSWRSTGQRCCRSRRCARSSSCSAGACSSSRQQRARPSTKSAARPPPAELGESANAADTFRGAPRGESGATSRPLLPGAPRRQALRADGAPLV
jgi:hypothetical protein